MGGSSLGWGAGKRRASAQACLYQEPVAPSPGVTFGKKTGSPVPALWVLFTQDFISKARGLEPAVDTAGQNRGCPGHRGAGPPSRGSQHPGEVWGREGLVAQVTYACCLLLPVQPRHRTGGHWEGRVNEKHLAGTRHLPFPPLRLLPLPSHPSRGCTHPLHVCS